MKKKVDVISILILMFLMAFGIVSVEACPHGGSDIINNDMEIYLREESIFQDEEYLLFETDKTNAQQNEEFYNKIPLGTVETPVEGGFVNENEYEEIREKALEIVNGLETDYEKLIAIHDWVADNIYYNYDYYWHGIYSSGVGSAYEVFKTGTGVCEGYANLTFVMLYACDIESYVVKGGGWSSRINHAWNLVRLDGEWITMDITWDSKNEFVDGEKRYGGYSYSYFFKSNEEFSDSHLSIGLSNNIWVDDIAYNIEEQMLDASKAKKTIVTANNILDGVEGMGMVYYSSLGSVFTDCKELREVKLPDSLKIIGEYAFYNCSNLETINFPNGLREIGPCAFDGCEKLKQIDIPYGLEEISQSSFSDCKQLQYVELPSTVTSIEKSAFFNCTALKEITIPKSVNYIGKMAFANCSNLTNVYYAGTEEEWDEIGIGSGNKPLLEANIIYEKTAPIPTDMPQVEEVSMSAVVSKDGDQCAVTADFAPIPTNKTLLISTYDEDGRLVYLKKINVTEESIETYFDYDPSMYKSKVMLWDSMDNMIPLAEAESDYL